LTGTATPQETANYYKGLGANVMEEYPECSHTYCADLPDTTANPRQSCVNGGVINCGDDVAGRSIGHAMGETMNSSTKNLDYNTNGQLYMFDQTPFLVGGKEQSKMWDFGYVYIPNKCLTEKCKAHMWFHGCGGTAGLPYIADNVFRATGIAEHASGSEFIQFWPQAWAPSDYGWAHCWAANISMRWDHPQFLSLRQLLTGFFDEELLDDDHPLAASLVGIEQKEQKLMAQDDAMGDALFAPYL